MKKLYLYTLLFVLVTMLAKCEVVRADSWAEPVKKESVRKTTKTKKIKSKTKAKRTKQIKGKKKTKVTSSTRISSGKKVVTQIKTVSQSVTMYKKGSRIRTVTDTKTVTTTKLTYCYYYNLRAANGQKNRQNSLFDLNELNQYLSQNVLNLLKAQDVRIYLYSTHSVLEKTGVVGLAVWNTSEKAAYIEEDQWYVILHEIGHILDCYAQSSNTAASQYCSGSDYFHSVFLKDRTKVESPYQTSEKEYFAESVMYFYLRRTKLLEERPDTYQAISLFVDSLHA